MPLSSRKSIHVFLLWTLNILRRIFSFSQKVLRVASSLWRIMCLRMICRGLTIPYSVRLDPGVRIRVTDGGTLKLGERVYIGAYTQIVVRGGSCSIGIGAELGQGCVLVCQDKIEIGDNTLIAEYVTIRDQDHVLPSCTRADGKLFFTTPITIGDFAWIGAKGTVLRGAEMGDRSTLGAHGLLNSSIPDNCVAVGVPAKVIDVSSQ